MIYYIAISEKKLVVAMKKFYIIVSKSLDATSYEIKIQRRK